MSQEEYDGFPAFARCEAIHIDRSRQSERSEIGRDSKRGGMFWLLRNLLLLSHNRL